MYLATAS